VQLPNADRVFIDDSKVRDYLLSDSHPVGRSRPLFSQLWVRFGRLGGVRDVLLDHGRKHAAVLVELTPFGQKYEVRGTIQGANGRLAQIVTVWIVRSDDSRPDSLRHTQSDLMFKLLDTIVLQRDLPEHGLRQGDVGAIVEVNAPDVFEVEFVVASGRTQALLTIRATDIRAVADDDLLAVRKLRQSA